ncbi:MAG: PAS domain S-box protein [Halanaeroarchaeum sp.]
MTNRERERIRVLLVSADEAAQEGWTADLEASEPALWVTTVANPETALDRLTAVDCVVSEHALPEMDGVAFLRTVRERHPGLPFVLAPENGSESVASEAIEAGVTAYVPRDEGEFPADEIGERAVAAVERAGNHGQTAEMERVTAVLKDVEAALVHAETRADLEQAVCDVFAESDPYRFAWIGEYDESRHALLPRAYAGFGEDYLETLPVGGDETLPEDGPGPRSIETGTVQISQNVSTDDSLEPYQDHAEDLGFRSVATVPLAYDDHLFGLLAIYADRRNAFGEHERDLLSSIGDDIGHAMDALAARADLRRFRQAVDAAGEAIGVTEADGTIEYVNPAFEEQTGYDESEVVGEKMGDVIEARPDAVRTEATVDPSELSWEREFRATRKSGEDYHAVQTITPIVHDTDALDGFVFVQSDITDRIEREEALRSFKKAVEHAAHSIYVTDVDGTIEYVNPAFEEQTGYDREEVIGETPSILNSGVHDDAFFEDMWETVLDGDVWESEIVNEREDGTRIHVDQSIAPVLDENGEIEHFVAINQDITDRMQYQRKLERQNRRLEEFASVLSHDLRNPLNVATGRLDLVEPADENVEMARAALDRMEAIIDDVLTLAREGQSVDAPEAVDLATAARDAWRVVPGDDADLDVDDSPTILADEDRLRRILENLFRNSVEHGLPDGSTGGDGSLTIRVGDLDDGFYVEDTGTGIPECDRDQVFESGYTRSEDGTGLGLSIVRQLARAHGWRVSVAEGTEGGARFEFSGVEREPSPGSGR